MLHFVPLVLLAACTVDVVLAAPQTGSTPEICIGYMWGVIVVQVLGPPNTVYNQYVETTQCLGPAWVQSSTLPNPPTNINPRGITYECEAPATQYYCGTTPVATCCGNLTTSS